MPENELLCRWAKEFYQFSSPEREVRGISSDLSTHGKWKKYDAQHGATYRQKRNRRRLKDYRSELTRQ